MPQSRKHESPADKQRAYRQRLKAAGNGQAISLPAPAPISAIPSSKRWKALRDCAAKALDTLLSEMEQYRDDRSETWQQSEKGEAFEEGIQQAQEALNAVEEIA